MRSVFAAPRARSRRDEAGRCTKQSPANLELVRSVAVKMLDQAEMPTWSVDYGGAFLAPLNLVAKRFSEYERPPELTEDERQALVSRALASAKSPHKQPAIFTAGTANWIVLPVADTRVCCAVVLLR